VLLAGGANLVQQYLAAGLVDEFELHLVPILLGDGERLLRISATSRSNRSARSRRLA
jgi:dihydrofolate reductase